MSGETMKHPDPVLAACKILGCPLPPEATLDKQPSAYIPWYRLNGSLDQVTRILEANGLLPKLEGTTLEFEYRKFRKRFKSQLNMQYTKADLSVYFTDWLLFARTRGFSTSCYFEFELHLKDQDVRDTFLNEGYRERVHSVCSKKSHRLVFRDKSEFSKTFSKYVNRDWVDASKCSFEEFEGFANRHDEFFAKPVRGSGGVGACRLKLSEAESAKKLFEHCKKEKLICEEIIKQHKDLAEINDTTLNTVRLITLLCADGTPRILLTLARFGRKNSCIDNFHGGGVGAIVDVDTGVIITDAIDMRHQRTAVHLDSGKMIKGFTYPEWEKVKAAVLDAATMIPEIRNIGWDVAVTEDGEVEFVEGNCRPNYHAVQSPDQTGRKFKYEPYLAEIEALEGVTYVEPEHLDFSVADTCMKKVPTSWSLFGFPKRDKVQ